MQCFPPVCRKKRTRRKIILLLPSSISLSLFCPTWQAFHFHLLSSLCTLVNLPSLSLPLLIHRSPFFLSPLLCSSCFPSCKQLSFWSQPASSQLWNRKSSSFTDFLSDLSSSSLLLLSTITSLEIQLFSLLIPTSIRSMLGQYLILKKLRICIIRNQRPYFVCKTYFSSLFDQLMFKKATTAG